MLPFDITLSPEQVRFLILWGSFMAVTDILQATSKRIMVPIISRHLKDAAVHAQYRHTQKIREIEESGFYDTVTGMYVLNGKVEVTTNRWMNPHQPEERVKRDRQRRELREYKAKVRRERNEAIIETITVALGIRK